MVSAYKDETNKQLVVVVINMTTAAQNINLSGVNFINGSVKSYTTSQSKDLSVASIADITKIAIEGRSVITLTGNYQ